MTIEIRTQAGQDSPVAEAAQELLELVSGEAPGRRIVEPEKEQARIGDPLTMGMIADYITVFSLPVTIAASIDLLTRPKVIAAAKKLLDAVRREKSAAFLVIEGKPLDLSKASEDDILDLLDQSLGK